MILMNLKRILKHLIGCEYITNKIISFENKIA